MAQPPLYPPAGSVVITKADGTWEVRAPYGASQLEAIQSRSRGKRSALPTARVLKSGDGEPPAVAVRVAIP